MTEKTVLITGANRSIGFETARQLGRSGYRVWLGSRDDARGMQAAERLREEGHDVRSLPIDITRDDSVRNNAVFSIEKKHGVLDVLINNAGILGAPPAKPSEQRIDDIRAVYETNVFGPIRVTQAFLSLLSASKDASVIMVSSGLGSLGWLSDPANPFHGINVLGYNSSKTALNAVTLSFAKEFAPLGIRVNAADPGYTATDFNGHTGYRTAEQAAAGIVWLAETDKAGSTGSFFFDQEVVPW